MKHRTVYINGVKAAVNVPDSLLVEDTPESDLHIVGVVLFVTLTLLLALIIALVQRWH